MRERSYIVPHKKVPLLEGTGKRSMPELTAVEIPDDKTSFLPHRFTSIFSPPPSSSVSKKKQREEKRKGGGEDNGFLMLRAREEEEEEEGETLAW